MAIASDHDDKRRRRERPARAYAPDYVSGETLAYRLDCSIATIQAYVRDGLLPPPRRLGGLVRWRFSEIEAVLDGLASSGADASASGEAAVAQRIVRGGIIGDDADPFLEGVRRVESGQA